MRRVKLGKIKNFEGFLKELYKHEHFLDISNISEDNFSLIPKPDQNLQDIHMLQFD